MAIFLKSYKVIRNNWKKSAFGAVILSYAASSAKTKYETQVFMEVCCKEAQQYGDGLLPVSSNPRSLTVILNPAANKRSAKEDYEKYCEPLLHLAGIKVTLLQTKSEGHAKELVSGLPENESIILAGGDGTLSEAITGILREEETKCKRTIGVLPLGRRNMLGNQLFPVGNKLPRIKQLTDATMAIIKDDSKTKDVMKIEVIENDSDHPKPIYAVGPIEWGAFRDAIARRDKYWFYGSLRNYATYIFNGYKNSLCWDCKGTLKISPPCSGCNNCKPILPKEVKSFKWLDLIMPKVKEDVPDKDYSKISNQNCAGITEKCFKTVEVSLSIDSGNVDMPPHLAVFLGKMSMGYFEFISEGWRRLNHKIPTHNEIVRARTIEIIPEKKPGDGDNYWYSIDNEEFDAKPIRVTILPSAVRVYCKC